ncbi:hypothetical protein AB835_06505 [Candidatus Endobugula sertula]|uniref:Toluene tolerance protein n=1 Tax=Candidatus Endobugula sertula TaxID=62101 RepID=A0A1D2QQL9_9GAMM|nr:hypothetical protein AB835_06505 [Candidatus Endobugula sertula]
MFNNSQKWVNVGLKATLAVFMVFMAVHVKGDYAGSEPHRVVSETTEKVFVFLKSGIDPVAEPDRFIAELSVLLEPVVAFQYIAQGVMGVHAKSASPEQIEQFASAFTKGLVKTYGKGISGFQGVNISVVPPKKPIGDARCTTVVQEIRTPDGVNKVSYSMAKNRQNQWKVINLVINGINFGKTFRGQFAAAVENNKGDVEKTISEWEEDVSAS